MIQLHSDCLVFKTATGQQIPCSAELVTIELIGEAANTLDPEMIRHATAAVLHYFREELGQTTVSVGEFTQALERVLHGFGLTIAPEPAEAGDAPIRVAEADLRKLAHDADKGFELVFFSRLRNEMRLQLKESPRVLRFQGLRGCVKQLIGARRWCGRCQQLSDQIVDYLRLCLTSEAGAGTCALVVQ